MAGLLTSAEDFVNAMGWQDDKERKKKLSEGVQQELFPTLTDEEQSIVNVLRKQDRLQINMISVATNIPSGKLSGILFAMEMKGVLRMLPGGMYRLN